MPIRERRGKWHYRFYLDNQEYAGNTGLDATERNRTAALRKEAEARRRVLDGQSPEKPKTQVMSFSEAAQQFLEWYEGEHRAHPNSAKRIMTSFASAKVFFGKRTVGCITSGDLEDYKSWRRVKHEVKDVTIRHDLHALSVFFQYSVKHGWCGANPIVDVDIPSDMDAQREHVLSPQEEALYFATCKLLAAGVGIKDGPFARLNKEIAATQYQALHDAARLILLQGVRPEEVMSARVEDITDTHWNIPKGKSKAARRNLKLDTEAKMIMEGRKMVAASGWLFPGKAGGHVKTFQRSHDVVLEKCGLNFVLYDLRHTFATRSIVNGVPLPALAELLGHANLRTVMRYVHMQQKDLDAAMTLNDAANSKTRPIVMERMM